MSTSPLTAIAANSAAATHATAPAAVSFASFAGMVLALLLVLALIVGMAWLLRRVSGLGLQGPASLRTVATLAVGPKERLLVVQAGDTQLLVGVTAQQITLLHQLDKPLPVPVPTNHFANLLARSLGRELPP